MGIDFIEIVTEVEEHFGVSIGRKEAFDVRTVGDLLELIEARVVRRETAECLTLPWFLKLRRLTREITNNPRLAIRPSTVVAETLNRVERQRLWKKLIELLGPTVSDLRRPWLVVVATMLLALATIVLLVASLSKLNKSLAIASAGCALLAAMLFVATRSIKMVPPIGYETFGEIARRLVGLEAVTNGYPATPRDLIFGDLAVIVATQLGVDLKDVTPEARFVQDLGMY